MDKNPITTNRIGNSGRSKNLIETEAIIVAYAMSRLDEKFLRHFAFKSWKDAFAAIGAALGERPTSIKNLRQEFDPIHPHGRRGWHQRAMRPNRQRVLGEFCDASDEALLEVVSRLLAGDKEVEEQVTIPMTVARDPVHNVAERLRTGRRAEEYFLDNSAPICGIDGQDLLDLREQACGFDFGVEGRHEIAIEVKGIKQMKGAVLFTENEWHQASCRTVDYWLVVIGGLERQPRAKVITNPVASLNATSSIRRSTVVSWTANVVVA